MFSPTFLCRMLQVAMKDPSEETARGSSLKARKGVLEETELAGTLTWNFHPLKMQGNICVLFKPLSVWYLPSVRVQ